MAWNPTSWFVASRVRTPDERPREYNDPSKQQQLDHYHDRSPVVDAMKIAAFGIPALALLVLAGFIVFNLLSGKYDRFST